MPAYLALTELQTLSAVTAFLQSVLPTDVPWIRGQSNNTPEPKSSSWIEITPIRRDRLSTNNQSWMDCHVIGSISGSILTVASIVAGKIVVGSGIFGGGVSVGTTVTNQLSSNTFSVSKSQTVTSGDLYIGSLQINQHTAVTVQLDIHGDNSADYAQVISTLFRDNSTCELFSSLGLGVDPLDTSDPRELPFMNAESQYEIRWSIDLRLQANPATVIPMQFAQQLKIDLSCIDVEFPGGYPVIAIWGESTWGSGDVYGTLEGTLTPTNPSLIFPIVSVIPGVPDPPAIYDVSEYNEGDVYS